VPSILSTGAPAGSLIVASALVLGGCSVSWPLEPALYDLLADTGAPPLMRIQVKTTSRSQSGTWVCSLTRANPRPVRATWGRRTYPPGEIDYFGVVDGDLHVYLIPYAVVAGLSVIHVRHYVRYRLRQLPTGRVYAPDSQNELML